MELLPRETGKNQISFAGIMPESKAPNQFED